MAHSVVKCSGRTVLIHDDTLETILRFIVSSEPGNDRAWPEVADTVRQWLAQPFGAGIVSLPFDEAFRAQRERLMVFRDRLERLRREIAAKGEWIPQDEMNHLHSLTDPSNQYVKPQPTKSILAGIDKLLSILKP